MFNGIIKNTGKIQKLYKKNNSLVITLKSKIKFSKSEIGSSICCSGTCLTLSSYKKNLSNYYLSQETIDRTNFKTIKVGDILNLEKSMKYGDRISGHFVQGHIETTCKVKKIDIIGKSWFITFMLGNRYKRNLVEKCSIALNGVSLTVSKIMKNGFQIAVIPQTLKLTNLFLLKKGDIVNVEFDILSKYIKKNSK